jgi:hypothetical protein
MDHEETLPVKSKTFHIIVVIPVLGRYLVWRLRTAGSGSS